MRRTWHRGGLCGMAVVVGFAATTQMPLSGQAMADDYAFHVSYRAYLSGVRVGSGELIGHLNGADYTLTATGEVSGIARVLSRYEGKAEARGELPDGSARFRADAVGDGEAQSIRLRLDGGDVKSVTIEPEPEPHRVNHPKRVQLDDGHKRGVMDPMRALVFAGGLDGASLDPEACERTLPVFSGGSRFDLALSYRGVDTVTSPRSNGYSGPVLVCQARYRPVAGHRTDHSSVEYLRDRARIEVMLAPMPNSDLLVPYRISVSTPLGPAVLQSQTFLGSGHYNTAAAVGD
jgi:hypothetical protein